MQSLLCNIVTVFVILLPIVPGYCERKNVVLIIADDFR